MSAAFATSADNGKKAPEISRNICLPSEDYVIQSWKVTAGSPVRVGDKIAVAVRRVHDDPSIPNNHTSSTGPNSTQSASAAAAAAAPHRRPKKRRRPGAVNGESYEGDQDGDNNAVKAVTQRQDAELTDTAKTRTTLLPPQDSVTLIAPADGLLRITSEQHVGAMNEKLPGMVGYIEECLHPQILMGMCAVCGVAIAANPQSESNNNISNDGSEKEALTTNTTNSNGDTRSNVTVSGGITMIVSEREGQHIAQQTAERLNKQLKLSLVLDLDHTLVHATYDARARTHLNRDDVRTVVLPVFENITHASQRQAWTWHYIKLRPHVKEFLESVLPMYEVGVYTAGTRLYAEQITMILSRHVVGAKMDQPELDGLRHSVAQMEHELQQQQQQQQNAVDESAKQPAKPDTKKPATSGKQANGVAAVDALVVDLESSAIVEGSSKEASSSSAQDATENGQEPNQNNEQPSRTRKRVTFDPAENVAQAAANHDHPEQEQVNNEGNEANGMERAGDQGDDDDEDVSHRKRVRFGEPGQNSWYNNAENDPVDEDSDAARGGCKPRKRVSFGDPPESNRVDPAELEELRQQLAEAERLELAASKLRQQLFGSRIVSRTDVGDLGKDVKSLRRIFPCGGTMAVVVDDREDVWANALDNASGRKGEPPENLLLVRPYHWKPFLGFADVNNAAGADLSSSSSSPSSSSSGDGTAASSESNSAANAPETDVQLLWTRDILERLHRKYFAENNTKRDPPKSVASILHDMRAKVLKNTRLVLSALVPLRKQARSPSLTAPRPPVVRIAESLGAKLLDTVEPSVTHVVAAKDGTEKTIRARRLPTCQVVKASWLMECLWSLTRRDEQPHWFTSSAGAVSPLRQPPPLMMGSMPTAANYNNYTKNSLVLPLDPRTESTTSSSSSSNSDNDEDEEDFAAALENELMDS